MRIRMTSTADRGAQGQSPRTLVILLRRALGQSWGVRSARVCAGLLALGVIGAVALTAGGLGANDTSLSLVARSAVLLVWFPGGICALSLASPPKDLRLSEGINALARARGFDTRRIARAETMASVRLLGEIILVPLVLMSGFVFAIAARGGLAGTARALAGSMLFGFATAVVLGLTTSLCRTWGGRSGRTWLLAVVLGPWIFAEVLLSGRLAPYASIPGLLGRLWDAFAAVST
jgi:hypothetical protein